MKKNFYAIAALSMCLLLYCGSKNVKQGTSDSITPMIKAQNEQLAKHSVGGFAYKSSKLNTQVWDNWAKSSAPVVKEIIGKLPEGYVLQVTGHTDSVGPEEPEGDKPGNINISKDRAKTIYDALRKAGIDSPRLTYKGMGSSELIQGINPEGAGQRRVTFKVVQAR